MQCAVRKILLGAAAIAGISLTANVCRAECWCSQLDLFCWPTFCYKCCPDNYCCKAAPCVPCLCWKGCCDSYCAKPDPCVPCVGGGSCYCYPPKPLPPIQCGYDQTYKCGPACAPAYDAASVAPATDSKLP